LRWRKRFETAERTRGKTRYAMKKGGMNLISIINIDEGAGHQKTGIGDGEMISGIAA
jgi:hypothetical protein